MRPPHLSLGHLIPFLQVLAGMATGSLDSPMVPYIPDSVLFSRYIPPRPTTKLSFQKIPAKWNTLLEGFKQVIETQKGHCFQSLAYSKNPVEILGSLSNSSDKIQLIEAVLLHDIWWSTRQSDHQGTSSRKKHILRLTVDSQRTEKPNPMHTKEETNRITEQSSNKRIRYGGQALAEITYLVIVNEKIN